MRTRCFPAALLAATMALGAAGPAGAGRTSPAGEFTELLPWCGGIKRLISNGRDGEETYYTAVCRDGRRATVIERMQTGETCANSLDGTRLCKKGWRLMDAGARACSGGERS